MYQIFYVDRIQLSGVSVNRQIPSFLAWDDNLLKQRQEDEILSCSFGGGRLLDRLEVNKDRAEAVLPTDVFLPEAQLRPEVLPAGQLVSFVRLIIY